MVLQSFWFLQNLAFYTAVESNPYVIWMLAYHQIYEEIVSNVDQLLDDEVHEALVKDGSVEDAMLYFESK